jgi:heme a synthase
MKKNRAFYKLSLSTLVAVYILILVGGVVRSTGSGMGCPDWPTCFGNWIPPTSVSQLPADYKTFYSEYRARKNQRFARYLQLMGLGDTAAKILADKSVLEEADFNAAKTWVEYINRVIGVIIGLLIFAVFVASWKYRNTNRIVTVVALATFLLVGFQGWIGSFVVSTNLTPWTVTVHMFLAMVIVAMLVYLVYKSAEQQPDSYSPMARWWLTGCIIVLLVQILLGTQVREAIDRVASTVAREDWISAIFSDFVIHRSFSWLVVILHIGLVVNLLKTTVRKTFPIALILLILGTILTGAGMAGFAVPSVLQPLHLLLATATFGMQFLLLLDVGGRQKPVLETP